VIDAKHALTVLTRLANRRPQEGAKLASALEGRLDRLGPIAVEVAIETGDPIGRIIDDLIVRHGDDATARRLKPLIPSETLALRELGVTATRSALAAMEVASSAERDAFAQAALYCDLAARLSAVGKRANALQESERAVSLLEPLDHGSPAAAAALARALATLSSGLADVARHQEALPPMQRSVELRRELAKQGHPGASHDLGIGLKLLAISLSALGRRQDAVAASAEATTLLRNPAEVDRSANLPTLAAQLAAEGTLRIDNGEFDQGIAAAAEALDLYRELAERWPDRYTFFVAVTAHNLANDLSLQRRFDESLPLVEEAVRSFANLAGGRPDAFAQHHARALNTYSNRLNDLARTDEAVAASQASVAIWRGIAAREPAAFEPGLAQALHSLAYRHYETGATELAIATIDEAIAVRRRLEPDNPDAFGVPVAMSLAVRAAAHRKAGRLGAACDDIAAAVRQLLTYARRHGPAVAREAREIGGRAVAWHRELGVDSAASDLEELQRRTGIDGYGTIS
jgi:tetratricopeptide (TPR) repeat protein